MAASEEWWIGRGPEDRLGAAEQVFDLQQIAIAQHRSTPCSGVILALVSSTKRPSYGRLVGELAGIDLKGRAGPAVGTRGSAQIAAIGGIADQRADSGDVARSFRDHVARRSDMMSPA
jgi:hypothetical protein